jgi:hypothetical protein
LDHRGRFFIRDDIFAVAILLFVAIGRPAAQPLSTLRLQFLDGTDLFAGELYPKSRTN